MLLSESESTIEKYLLPEINIDLATLIRCVTFRVFLVVFLRVNPNPLEFVKVQRVTGAISEFYDDGQGNSTLPLDVQRMLYEWLPRRRFPSSLDRILPAYEALWRIIATIVVTCEDDDTRSLRWMILDFRDNPRDRQYSASTGNDGRSVSDITDDAVGRLTPIARPQSHATSPDWQLSCIQHAISSRSTSGHPTVSEGLKFGALLASKVIGRVGVHYGISGRGTTDVASSQASPWEQRRIFGIHNVPHHLTVSVLEMFPHASTSRQAH